MIVHLTMWAFDIPKVFHSPFLQALESLINLAKGRFVPADILDFFSNPCVRRRCHISPEDLFLLEKWAKHCGVRWGFDQTHRDQLLALPGFEDQMLEQSDRGTWQYCFDGLLAGLAVVPCEDTCHIDPLDFVENANADALGKWIHLIQSLKQTFQPMALARWKKWIATIGKQFIHPDIDHQGYQLYSAALDALSCQTDSIFPFESLWQRLKNQIDAKNGYGSRW